MYEKEGIFIDSSRHRCTGHRTNGYNKMSYIHKTNFEFCRIVIHDINFSQSLSFFFKPKKKVSPNLTQNRKTIDDDFDYFS